MGENKILVRIPFDKSNGEFAPSFEQFGVFYREFGKLLTREEREQSEVEFEEGSIKIWISIISLLDFSANFIEAINAPKDIKSKVISTNIHNAFNNNKYQFKCSFIEINNTPATPRDYSEELSKVQKLDRVEYKVIKDRITEEYARDANKNTGPKTIKKCIATATLLEGRGGFKKGYELQFITDIQFCEREVVYIASFIKDGNNWELLDEPMTITQR